MTKIMTVETSSGSNIDSETVRGFGDEWSRFTQGEASFEDKEEIFNDYFKIFPWMDLPKDGGTGADIGCGSGRWATMVAPKVKKLILIDASKEAIAVAKANLSKLDNVDFVLSSVGSMPIPDESLDFAYSLGVLHHVPDTLSALRSVSKKLRSGAPFLVYLYYAFDNQPALYRSLWRLSESFRYVISRLPLRLRYYASQMIALLVYWPLSRSAKLLKKLKITPKWWPLSYYSDKSFYVMRTDALDRFGTRLEQRFTQAEIKKMLESSGFEKVKFSESMPYWTAVAYKA